MARVHWLHQRTKIVQTSSATRIVLLLTISLQSVLRQFAFYNPTSNYNFCSGNISLKQNILEGKILCIYNTDVNNRINYHPVDITVTYLLERCCYQSRTSYFSYLRCIKRPGKDKILLQYSRTSVSFETVS